MVNVPTLKGVHYAMHAGMFAAEAIYERLKTGSDRVGPLELPGEGRGLRDREGHLPLAQHAPAVRAGFFVGGAIASMMEITGGRIPGGRWATHDDATMPVFIGPERDYPKPDGKTTFDKLSSVFATGNATRDDAPNHIRIQDKVPLEVALMWQNMCPAQVYEVPDEELEAAAPTATASSTASAR